MKWAIPLAAVAAFVVSGATCRADTEVIAKAGVWQAFAGKSDSGRKLCGMSSSGGGKYYSVKYYAGDEDLTVQLGNKKWTVKDKTKVKVEMKFDAESPWTATAVAMHFGDGDAGLEFNVSAKQIEEFIKEFAGSNQIAVKFPGSDVESWNGTLDGSDVVTPKFAQCIKKMA